MRPDDIDFFDDEEMASNVSDYYGIDYNNLDYLGKNIFRRIRDRIRARIKARNASGTPKKTINLQTSAGSMVFGPGGFSMTQPGPGGVPVPVANAGMYPGMPQSAQTGGSIIQTIQNNPVLLAIPAIGLFMLLKTKKAKK